MLETRSLENVSELLPLVKLETRSLENVSELLALVMLEISSLENVSELLALVMLANVFKQIALVMSAFHLLLLPYFHLWLRCWGRPPPPTPCGLGLSAPSSVSARDGRDLRLDVLSETWSECLNLTYVNN
ncbi:hypothetical protein EVAR_30785_1 [Eumeta japonica]|uniref:Uncharacterized protein n=1 Tax=Eumeta variegata TaxID=151549 RepID=A0A4C1V604_EUMVA|nr:hypothetical protein EVAR_30785_1 [Eumeta japonica]